MGLKEDHDKQVKTNRRDFFEKCQTLQIKYSNFIDKSKKHSKEFVEKLDVVMQDGDRVYVPAKPSTVLVMGSVNRPNAMIWRPGRAVTDYVGQAGGATREAARDVLVARANGSVQRVDGGFFGGGTAVLPGDTILVMENTDHISNRRLLRDWTQIIYQGALGVAGLRLLSDVFSK